MATEIKRLRLTGVRTHMPAFVSDTAQVEIVLHDDGTLMLKTGDTLRELVQTHVQQIVAKRRGKGLDVFWSLLTAGVLLLLARVPVWAAVAFLLAILISTFEFQLYRQFVKPALVFDTPYTADNIALTENEEPAREISVLLHGGMKKWRPTAMFALSFPPTACDPQEWKQFVALWQAQSKKVTP